MEYMTTKEVAEILNLSVQYTRRLAFRGVIKSNKVGKQRLYKREDIIEYIEKGNINEQSK